MQSAISVRSSPEWVEDWKINGETVSLFYDSHSHEFNFNNRGQKITFKSMLYDPDFARSLFPMFRRTIQENLVREAPHSTCFLPKLFIKVHNEPHIQVALFGLSDENILGQKEVIGLRWGVYDEKTQEEQTFEVEEESVARAFIRYAPETNYSDIITETDKKGNVVSRQLGPNHYAMSTYLKHFKVVLSRDGDQRIQRVVLHYISLLDDSVFLSENRWAVTLCRSSSTHSLFMQLFGDNAEIAELACEGVEEGQPFLKYLRLRNKQYPQGKNVENQIECECLERKKSISTLNGPTWIRTKALVQEVLSIKSDKLVLEWFYPMFFEKKFNEFNDLYNARLAHMPHSKEMSALRFIHQRLANQFNLLKSLPNLNSFLSFEKSLSKYTSVLEDSKEMQKKLSELIKRDKKGNLYERIASGKAKIVWLPLTEIQSSTIYYTPTGLDKVQELQYELTVAKKIQKKLLVHTLLTAYQTAMQQRIGQSSPQAAGNNFSQELTFHLPPIGRHLQVNMRETDLCIDGSSLTIAAPQAIGDAENFIRLPNFSLNQAFSFAEQFIEAMVDLHASAHIHGDLKPENLLVMGQQPYTLQLSDWGKTTKVKLAKYYSGNPRFGAPEGSLSSSQSGDVFSVGLILIRFLEEPVLKEKQQDILIQPLENKPFPGPIEKLRGIEKFVVTNYRCPQSNNIMGRINNETSTYPKAENEIYRYIDALIKELLALNSDRLTSYKNLQILLKSMTQSDPSKRLMMKEVQQIFNSIKNKLQT